jgi:hypothetical protein
MRAPTREEWALQQAEAEEAARAARPVEERIVNDGNESNAPAGGGETAREVLIVVSKLKQYIKAKSGMNTSDAIVPVLSDLVRTICDQAIESARSDGRKTVLDRDIKPPG